jgi:hypothetical protein
MSKSSRPSALDKLWNPGAKSRHRKSARKARPRRTFESLESRQMMAVTTFQHGMAGYEGTQDTVIFSLDRDTNFGTEGHVSADQQDFNNVRQGLLKFDGIFGNGPNQIPFGSTINSAILDLTIQDDSNAAMQMSLYRMQQDWNESVVTWNSFGAIGGVQASEGESSDLPPDAVLLDSETDADRPATAGRFDVKKSIEYWAAGTPNYGWLLESAATNGWDWRTKESTLNDRPKLIIDYTAPGGGNSYQVLSTVVTQAEGNSGTQVARIDVARLGDLSAAASINYTAIAGGASPAQAGDFVAVPAPTALNFAPGQGLATIEVTINSDTDLEGLETILVSLSGGTTIAGRSDTTVTIGDDDALINEVLANVTSSDDETDREYIELVGTPGASLAGYYFVIFEGEEEENSGAGSGIADIVIDLSSYSFGSNGLLVLVPGDPNAAGHTWEYASLADPATNIVELTALMGNGGILEDNSQTYALIRSTQPIVQGTDYDTVGAYENADATAIGVGVGILDQLPASAQWIDSVGVVEGGGGDRDRVATPPSLGHPGIHVHQPTPAQQGGNVTSDAVTRRFGQALPNSIGAWFNGDIADGTPASAPIRYLENQFPISVVAPDGAVLTPGAHNILRNVFFRLTDQAKSVAEADGSVTIRIERTGDIANESLTVTYSTFDFGSADEGADFTAKSETLTFNPGESFKDVTITINAADGLAEGFERFRVVLSNASAGYQITNGSPTSAGNPNGEATVTITDANVSLAVFQNGVNDYMGTKDAYIDGEFTTDFFGQDPVIRVDQAKGTSVGPPQQGLIRFDDMFGAAMGQVPLGSQIFDAFLTLNVSNTASGGDIRFFRMLQDWEQVTTSWESPQGAMGAVIQNGVTPDGFEATAKEDARVTEPGKAGKVQIPLNVETIQAWANGSLANNGWSIVSNSPSLWSFNSSEAFLAGTFKPELTILYTAPEVANAGTFGFSVDAYSVNESGGSATITVNRVGGSAGAAAVNWDLTAGTASLADVTGATAGVLNFAAGELFKTFNVAINNDVLLERNETLNLTLSGAGLTFDQATATLTIRDNDFSPVSGNLLLNEIYMNSPGNDPPHEFIELAGLANMGLGSLYYVAVEGLVGSNEGAFDKVVDLGAYLSGSNGLTLLTPQEPGYAFNVNPATTHIQDLGTVAVENVNTNNDSVTIMILYSPSRELSTFAFDYDWNNDGSLDLPTGVQVVDSLGVRTLGLSDQVYGPTSNILAFTATEVDSVSRKRGDVDRNDGLAWFGGNLTSAGDDYLLYEASSTALPLTGASMSPGDLNAGTAVQSPLVALTGVTVNPNGTVTVNFNGPISQVLSGDGSISAATGAGVSITDTSGIAIPVVDLLPTVTGIGSNSLTLAFTGSGVTGGFLPAGMYQLNFVGNGFVGNSRAVDVANNGTQVGGFFEFEFTVAAPGIPGDYDGDAFVNGNDFLAWQRGLGSPVTPAGSGADGDNSGTVDAGDLTVWRNAYPTVVVAAAAAVVAADEPEALTETAQAESAPVNYTSVAQAAGAVGTPATRSARPTYRPSLLLLPLPLGEGRGEGADQPALQSAGKPSYPHADLDDLFAELGEESESTSLAAAGISNQLAGVL